MKSEGYSKPFSTILDMKYLSSQEGSSLSDIQNAALDAGFHVLAVKGMSPKELRNSPYKVILHVKKDPYLSTTYNHYVLYLGEEDGLARLYDPPGTFHAIPYNGLLASWDGWALIVSADPISTSEFTRLGMLDSVPLITVIVMAISIVLLRLVATRLGGRTYRQQRLSIRSGVLVLIATGAGLCFQSAYIDGLLANSVSADVIREKHFPTNIPSMEAHELAELMRRQSLIIIDARHAKDYEAGHIPSAVNIPVSLESRSSIMSRMNHIDRSEQIVVYCQSLQCPYASLVARRLVQHCGFENVSIYHAGWNEWEELAL